MQPALHQHPRAAERDRLVDLLADLFERANVSVRCARSTVERAERADNVADVRVVDVAIDDVSYDVIRMAARANLVSGHAHPRDVVRFEQERTLIRGHPLSGEHPV